MSSLYLKDLEGVLLLKFLRWKEMRTRMALSRVGPGEGITLWFGPSFQKFERLPVGLAGVVLVQDAGKDGIRRRNIGE